MRSRRSSGANTSERHRAAADEVLRALLSGSQDHGQDGGQDRGGALEQILLRESDAKDGSFLSLFADQVEYHGVAALIEPAVAALPRHRPEIDELRRTIVALASRQRRAATAREDCVDRLLAAFAAARIPVLLLKGAALAHRIYPRPELRSMVDIDVLIDPLDSARAVAIASEIGFSFASRHDSPFAGRMHHLPGGTIGRSGFQIALEIHLDAMSPDQAGSLTMATLTAEPQSFRRGSGPDGVTLGHADMLRHLARHAFEPVRCVRLKHLYDLWLYQAVFRDEIDWRALAARCPEAIVALRLVSYVFASPPHPPYGAAPEPPPAGVGRGMVPLSEIAAMEIGLFGKLSALFNPPAWWLHGYYGIPPENSLLVCRAVRHPLTLARWLARRLAAGIGQAMRACVRPSRCREPRVSKVA